MNNYQYYIIICLFELLISMMIQLGTIIISVNKDSLTEKDMDDLSELAIKANNRVQEGKQLVKD